MNVDDILQLQQPLKDGGIRTVNFFNGRLLAGKDLSREQDARRESESRLGLALGEGVAFGLEVASDTSPGLPSGAFVRVTAGLAINRAGQTLRLTQDITVGLTRQFTADFSDACLFSACTRLEGGTYVAGAGVYVLTIAPTNASEGRAATNGLDPQNVRCATDANVEALQFRLLMLTRTMLAGIDLAGDTLRNELAYRCFGAGIQAGWFASLPAASARSDDLLDALRDIGLGDQEVPLALLDFRGASDIVFVDNWAVRRPLHRPESGPLAGLVEGRRHAVGHAMFMQFQQQIADLGSPVALQDNVTAKGLFRYLPPVGIVPVVDIVDSGDAAATQFFAGLTYRGPSFINAARLERLVRDSLAFPPIDTQSGELVWLYRVRESRMSNDMNGTTRGYIVFSSGHLPYLADAQFDVAHWNYSNFALAR